MHARELDGDGWGRAPLLLDYTAQATARDERAAHVTKLTSATTGCGSKYPIQADIARPAAKSHDDLLPQSTVGTGDGGRAADLGDEGVDEPLDLRHWRQAAAELGR